MKSFFSFFIVLLCITPVTAQLELQTKWWQPNGTVQTVVKDTTKNIVYIGGDFNYVGPEQAYATQINLGEPNVSSEIPMPNGNVLCSTSDGNGGWYIGGTFTKVGDSIRNCLAHISNNGVVTNWDPKMSPDQYGGGSVNCIVKQGQLVYVGGRFTTIGGKARISIAALDSITGVANSWDANLLMQANVRVIKINKNVIYVGGDVLININSPQPFISFDLTSGLLNTSPIKVFGQVYDILFKNDTIIIGGEIYSINGASRSNLGAINANTSQVLDLYPADFNGIIHSMAIKDNLLIVAGSFTGSRNRLARIDMTTGLIDDWNPNVNNDVLNVVINNNDL